MAITADQRGLSDFGWMYYPFSCIGKRCKLVLFFHGGGGQVIDQLTHGMVQTAAANNLIVVFPQMDTSSQACFDVTGYSGKNFNTVDGLQPKAILSMISKLKKPQTF